MALIVKMLLRKYLLDQILKNSAMTTYKLYYFKFMGLGEPIRYLLKYGGIDFQDIRIDGKSRTWVNEWKSKMPFGTVPVLEINGKMISHTSAICRYLAKNLNLVGANDWENLEIEMIVGAIDDFRKKLQVTSLFEDSYKLEKGPKSSREVEQLKLLEIHNFYLSRFERIAQQNNGYLANKKFSWADLYFVASFYKSGYVTEHWKSLSTKYPNLAKLCLKVNEIPAIKEWIEQRPKSRI